MKVSWVDREAALAALAAAATRLRAERPEVLEVHLFGSMARGRAHPAADADVLVVLGHSVAAPADRVVALRPFFLGLGVPVDLVVYTREELRSLDARNHPFLREV